MSKINNAIEWIDELLDTDYTQLKGQLGCGVTGFCCLGVANHSLDLNEKDEELLINTYKQLGLKENDGTFYNEKGYPVELDASLLEREEQGLYNSLAELNDSGKFSFKEIGELIRDYPEYIFIKTIADKVKQHYAKN